MTTYQYAGQYGPAQMTDKTGRPLPALSVTVNVHGSGTLAALYTDRTKGTGSANPLQTDTLGNLTFWADPGLYDIIGNNTTLTVAISADPQEPMTGDVAGALGGGGTILEDTTNVAAVVEAIVGGAGPGGSLLKTNNLSDVANALGALGNIKGERRHMNALAASMAAVPEVSNIPQMTAGSTVIDGYTVQSGDIVLLVGQANAAHNGPWVVPPSGANCTRPDVFSTGAVIFSTQVRVGSGSLFGNSFWGLSTPTAGITVDTSNQTWNLQSQTAVNLQTSSSSTITLAVNSTNIYTGTSNVQWNLPGTPASGGTPAAPMPYPGAQITIINQSATATISIGAGAGTSFQGATASPKIQPGQSITVSYAFDFANAVGIWYVLTGSMTNVPMFNVLLFGADPTGANDSATAIQAAINAAGQAGGGIVYFPPGTYEVGTTLQVGNGATVETTIRAGSSGSTLNLSADPGVTASGKVTVYTGTFTAQQVSYTSKTGSGGTTQLLGCTGLPTLNTGMAVVQGTTSTYNGITLMGAGQPGVDSGFLGWQAPPVIIKWIGGNGGSVFSINGPIQGLQVQNLFVNCNAFGTANFGFSMTAMQGSRFDNVFVNAAANTAYYCTGVNGAFPASVPAGNNQSNSTLPNGSWQYNDFYHVGCTVPPTNFAQGFRFTGDATGQSSGNAQGSAGCTYSNFRGTYVAQNNLSGTNQSTCFFFDFADDLVFEDTTIINTATPGSASYYVAKFDYTVCPFSGDPSAIIFDKVAVFGTGLWFANGSSGAFAPNVVKGVRANFINGTGPSANLADPNVYNLRWDVPGGERFVFSGSTNFFTTTVPKQIDPVNPTMLVITCTTAAGLAITMGPSSGSQTPVESSIANWAVGAFLTVPVPAGWWVKCTGTIANFAMTAMTRNSE